MDYNAITDELNSLARKGVIVAVGPISFMGPTGMALADGSSSIHHIQEGAMGRAGAIFYQIDGWELRRNTIIVASWIYSPGLATVELKYRAYCRAIHWLLLKAHKNTVN